MKRPTEVQRTAVLRPLNRFARARQIKPLHMDQMTLTPEQMDACANVALGILADMSNAGRSFTDALVSIYISGLQHGVAIARGEPE